MNGRFFPPAAAAADGARRRPAVAAALFLLAAVLAGTSGCGIASYPYLEPPKEALGVEDGFRHQSQENEASFLSIGYEIYYRIYDSLPSESEIGDGLTGYFQSRAGFEQVSTNRSRDAVWDSGESSDIDNPYWLAVASESQVNPASSMNSADLLGLNNPPLFPIDLTYGGDNSFDVEFAYQSEPATLTILPDSYPSTPKTIYLYRRVTTGDNDFVRDFSTDEADYLTDHVDVPAGSSGDLYIAFFAVIYGYTTDLTPVYANSQLGRPKENIVHIGIIEAY
jgi:hypothetical protein